MVQIYLNSDQTKKLEECVGFECKNADDGRKAIEHLMNKSKIDIPTSSSKKVKGKFKINKAMSVEHDISELVRREVEKATKGNQQTTAQPQEHPHKAHLEAMTPGINFLHCKNCGKMENPKGLTKKYNTCNNCGANTIHPNADVCPYCGNDDKEEFSDDGIEIENE